MISLLFGRNIALFFLETLAISPFNPSSFEHLSHFHSSIYECLVNCCFKLLRTFTEGLLIATIFPCGRVGCVHNSSDMSRQPKLRPKSQIPGYSSGLYDVGLVATLADREADHGTCEKRREQRISRVKRKHVLKACDRCRVKKTKVGEPASVHRLSAFFNVWSAHTNQCDGKQPCNRCSTYNHPCLFRERKATQTKVYSRG